VAIGKALPLEEATRKSFLTSSTMPVQFVMLCVKM